VGRGVVTAVRGTSPSLTEPTFNGVEGQGGQTHGGGLEHVAAVAVLQEAACSVS
jgi:hypothetical protein